jgi:hypothetical protein
MTEPFKKVFEDTENVPSTVKEHEGFEVLIPMFELNKRTLLSDLRQYMLLLAKNAVFEVLERIGNIILLFEIV